MFPATHRQGHGHGHGLLAKGTNGNLSLVWIAATLGPKAHLKRISKREIVSLNVPAACRLIAEPTPGGETLPLRISSTLLSGVSRVYGQQYNLHFNNVINVIDQIRLHLSSKRPTEITLEQPKISDEHRIETITLPLYPDIDLFGPATTLDLPAFLPPLTPIAPAAFPEEFLPGPAPGGAAPPAYRAGTPSMELGRGYEPSGIGMGMTSDLSTSDLGGYAGGYVFPESARAGAAGLESPSFISSTRTSLSSRRVSGLRATGAGAVPTISELAMAAEREHGIMDLDLGLDLPPLPAGQEEIGRPLGFGRMSPLLQALPSLSPEPGARPQPMFGEPMIPPPMIEEEHPTPAVFHEEEEEPLQDLEPIPKRRRVAGPRHPRLDQMTELPAAYWRNPPIVPHAALVRPPTPTRDQVMDCVFGPLIADIDEEFADMGRVGMFARQQVRLEHEELAPGLARVPPAPPEAEQLSYPAYAERMFTPEPETRRARSVSAELGHPGDVSTEQYRPPYAFGIEDLTAEPHEPPTRLPSDLESPGRVGGFVLPISPIMEPGLTSDISSMAGGPEPQLLFPPSPMLAPMCELTEEPADISTTHYASAMQQQSLNFYQRTKVLLEASATGELAFVDMLPARTRVVAAQAFYHLLTLVTQGKFKVHQEAPYEVIHVTGVDHDEDEDVEEM